MKLAKLNIKAKDQFLETIGGPLEGEIWLAERIMSKRPFASVAALHQAFAQAIHTATETEKVRLIASHPDLAPSVATSLSASSVKEQAAAGLNRLTPQEYTQFQQLNAAYHDKYGFPFVICARENTKERILEIFADRLTHSRSQEIEIAIREILKIIRLRLDDLIDE